MTAPATRKPARVYVNVRLGVSGLAAIGAIREQAGEHVTRSDVLRECLAEVLGDDVRVRAVLRRLRTLNAQKEDARNERLHKQRSKGA